jgi:hypothetical protein
MAQQPSRGQSLYGSETGELAGREAAEYIQKVRQPRDYTFLGPGENASFVVPQKIERHAGAKRVDLFMRVRKPEDDIVVYLHTGGHEDTVSAMTFAADD